MLIEFPLKEEHKIMIELIKEIGETYIKPYSLEWDEKEAYDAPPIKALQ